MFSLNQHIWHRQSQQTAVLTHYTGCDLSLEISFTFYDAWQCTHYSFACRLTSPLGHQMAELPLDPRLGRALLAACKLGCNREVAIVAAMLSVNSIWYAGHGQKALNEAKSKSVSRVMLGLNCDLKRCMHLLSALSSSRQTVVLFEKEAESIREGEDHLNITSYSRI